MREKTKFGILGIVVGAILAGTVVYVGFMVGSQGNAPVNNTGNNNGGVAAAPLAGLPPPSTQSQPVKVDCAVRAVTATIQGNSMEGTLSDGQQVSVLQNYYACNDVARGDVVVYNFPSGPIVKRVVGLPGDSFGVKQNGTGWNILVNGKALVNASGTAYLLSDQTSKMLALYATSDKGIIPADGYMILGNVVGGSEDSTAFGLVSKADFTGKVKM
jgi:signal peptidase I